VVAGTEVGWKEVLPDQIVLTDQIDRIDRIDPIVQWEVPVSREGGTQSSRMKSRSISRMIIRTKTRMTVRMISRTKTRLMVERRIRKTESWRMERLYS